MGKYDIIPSLCKTRAGFIATYCNQKRILEDEFHVNYVAMRCNCGEFDVEHWAAIRRVNVRQHLQDEEARVST